MWTNEQPSGGKPGPSNTFYKGNASYKPDAPLAQSRMPEPHPLPRPTPYGGRRAASGESGLSWLLLLGGAYLLGELWSSLFFSRLSSGPLVYAQYYYETILSLCREGQFSLLLGTRFLACFFLFTGVLLMGFCTFGVPVLFLLSFLKGVAAGSFFIQLFTDVSQKGIVSAILLFWPPEILFSLLALVLFRAASLNALALWRTSKGSRLPALQASQRVLLRVYLRCAILSIFPCGLTVLLCKVFGFLLA